MNRQEKIFQEYTVWHSIAAMALPAMVSMVVMILYNMTDMFFVGLLGDTAQIAAVSVVGPVFSLIMAVGSMLGSGGCALIARTLGAQNGDGVKQYSSVCCWGALAIGLVFTGALLLFRGPLLRFLGANEEMWQDAQTYLTILAVGAPIMIFASAYGMLLRAEGAVREGMVANLLATAGNMLLDPLFILALGMGVGGAAVATVLGNCIGSVYLVRYVRRRKSNLSLSLRMALARPAALGEVIFIGLPNAVSTALSSFASALANQLLVQYGTNAVAAMAAASKTTMVIGMIQMGLCMGVQPLLAYHYGARDLPRLRETLLKLVLLTVLTGGALTAICMVNSGGIVGLFLQEAEPLALGQQMVRLLVISGPFLGLFYIGSNFLQASGNAPLATFVSLLRQGLFLVPLLYLMNHFFGVTGNIWAHVIADIASAAVSVALTLWQYRRLCTTIGRPDAL
ncbi:MAG: MATE family efflux transporter [Clostridiales bacterium]|nr:MATE family efflux transporter [Clostridiales bacterium]